jgi:MYXO-CTERM domain-containing protein
VRQISLLGLLFALLALTAPARAYEVESLRESGPPDKRFNIAVLGDGYRTQDQAKLKTDAQDIVDYLFNVSPLKQYAKFFNVRLVHVISNEAGADNGSAGGQRDTALNSYFNCNNIDRLLCVDEGAAQSVAADDVPEFNFILVIVNDSKYGGSGGSVSASSSNESSFEVVAHEVGHSMAHLADEYDYDGGIGPCNQQQDCSEANATVRNQRDQIKWKAWLEDSIPVPTPEDNQYQSAIGVFEGARYQQSGTYRPKISCKMKDLGTELCSVCQEQFVRSFWQFENVQMIESMTPAQSNVQLDTCDALSLSVTSPPITPSSYRYTWTVDGKMLPETTGQLQLQPATLMKGTHDVDLVIEDATALVRNDPNGLLKDEQQWTITVSRDDCVASGGTGGAGGAAGAAGVAGGGTAGGGAAGAGGAVGLGGAGGVGGGAAGLGGSAIAGFGAGGATSPPRTAPPPADSAGCGCRSARTSSSSLGSLALLALGFVVSRRRRSRHAQHAS